MLPTARFYLFSTYRPHWLCCVDKNYWRKDVLACTFSKNGLKLYWYKHLLQGSPSLKLKSAPLVVPTWINHQPAFIHTPSAWWLSSVWLALVGTVAEALPRGQPQLRGSVLAGFPVSLAVSFLPWVHLPSSHSLENRNSLHFLWSCYINWMWLAYFIIQNCF